MTTLQNIITDYNQYMGGVNVVDQHCILCHRSQRTEVVEARVLSSDGNWLLSMRTLYTQTKQPRQCTKPQILPFGAGTGPMQPTASHSDRSSWS